MRRSNVCCGIASSADCARFALALFKLRCVLLFAIIFCFYGSARRLISVVITTMQVTKLYAQQDRARQHPNYRMPVTVLAHTSNSNSNNNNNSRSDSSKSGTSVQPDDISSRMLSKDSSEPEQERTNIFVWNRPIETGSPSSKVLDTEQGASALSSNVVGAQQRPLHRQLSSDQSRQESFLVSGSSAVNSVPSSADEEIVKSTQSMSLETAKQKFRSKTPTPQTGPGISVAAQHRRSKTPTPMSNKALLRARAAGQLPSVAPVARQNSTPDAPLSVAGDDPASSDNPVAPPRRRGNQRGGDVTSPPTTTPEAPQFPVNPQIFPSWPIPNTVMFPASFNPTMASSNYHPYMYEMWKFYASLSPEQRSLMFPTANQQLVSCCWNAGRSILVLSVVRLTMPYLFSCFLTTSLSAIMPIRTPVFAATKRNTDISGTACTPVVMINFALFQLQ